MDWQRMRWREMLPGAAARVMAPAIAPIMALVVAGAVAASDVRRLEWDDLMPADWDPFAALDGVFASASPDQLADGTADAERMMAEYRAAVASAPVVGELDGQRVQLPGFVVPLDFSGTAIGEFLLVPYYGACIHTPPPPANQIVHVRLDEPYPLEDTFAPVWVTGTLRTERVLHEVGDAGYVMEGVEVMPYE